jgi:hypothetical protein
VDHPPDGALLFNSANPEDSLPVLSADETYAFSFTGTAANSKAEFLIKVQDAGAGATPCDVHSAGLPSEQNKRKRSDGRKVSRWPLSDQTVARPARAAREVHGIVLGGTASSRCRRSGKKEPRMVAGLTGTGIRKSIKSGLGAGR